MSTPAARLPSFLVKKRGPLVTMVQRRVEIDMDEWLVYCEIVKDAFNDVNCTILVITDRAPGPSAVQRNMLASVTPKHVRTAIVTDSSVARGIVTLLGYFHETIRAFPTLGLDRALDYLNVAPGERPLVLNDIASMRVRLLGIGADTEADALGMLEATAIDPTEAIVEHLPTLRDRLVRRSA